MKTSKPQAATGWIHLALFVLGPLLAVVVVAYFTASPSPMRYRASQDPLCQQLLFRRDRIVAKNPASAGRGGPFNSDETLKQIEPADSRGLSLNRGALRSQHACEFHGGMKPDAS
jgi:hypothetical protein